MVLFGSISGFQFVWNMADLFMGAMAITNLISIMLLAGIAIKVLKDYTRQRKEGKDPMFQPHTIIGLKNVEAKEKKIDTQHINCVIYLFLE